MFFNVARGPVPREHTPRDNSRPTQTEECFSGPAVFLLNLPTARSAGACPPQTHAEGQALALRKPKDASFLSLLKKDVTFSSLFLTSLMNALLRESEHFILAR